jgi:hypothetical protein
MDGFRVTDTASGVEAAAPAAQERSPFAPLRIPSAETIVASTLIAAVVAWRTWASLLWSFQRDDWVWVAEAARKQFLPYVTWVYHGHLQPAQFAIIWVVTRLSPLNYPLAMAPVLILTAVSGVLMWRFLGALFGERSSNLIPLAVFMLCPLTLPSALWLTTALGIVPLQLFIVATLYAVLTYVRRRSTARLAVVCLTYAGALLFWEKSLLILPLVVIFVLLYLGRGSGWSRLRDVTAPLWRLWALLGGISACYTAWYLVVATSPLASRGSVQWVAQLVRISFGSTLIPTFVGGPWSVGRLEAVPPFPGESVPINVLPLLPRLGTWVLLGAIVATSLLLRRQAWRAWVVLSAYVGLCLGLVIEGRLGSWSGPMIGLSTRYVADAVPVFALALALSFSSPLERRTDPSWAARDYVVRATEARAVKRTARRVRRGSRGRRAVVRFVGIAAVLTYAVSAMITNQRMAEVAHAYSVKTWLAAARSSLAAHPTASIFDSYLPANALASAYAGDAARASHSLAPIAPDVRWNAPAEQMLTFDASGHLVPLTIDPVTSAKQGPASGCGYRIGAEPVTIVSGRPLAPWLWGLDISYMAIDDVRGFIDIQGDRQPVTFLRGSHHMNLIHFGPVASVAIWDDGSRVCVSGLRVGRLAHT